MGVFPVGEQKLWKHPVNVNAVWAKGYGRRLNLHVTERNENIRLSSLTNANATTAVRNLKTVNQQNLKRSREKTYLVEKHPLWTLQIYWAKFTRINLSGFMNQLRNVVLLLSCIMIDDLF